MSAEETKQTAPVLDEALETAKREEKTRLLELLFKETPYLVESYKGLMRYTGSLFSVSMSLAYAKGLSDAAKLINKEKIR